ncbi:HAMP domain-containing sensor histidine kinase [Brooklawnia sp.]|uniref:sensor histidine kinase n=1 Tax=Brooklawnia sp. TaxID=2699740 RepID=UPI00311D8044
MGEAAPRPPGLSVRVKLTLSYAGFLVFVSALILALVWIFLLRYVPPEATVVPGEFSADGRGVFFPGRYDLIRAFVPVTAVALLVLLAVGLVGGWFLAGRMLRPLDQISAATRKAAQGTLSYRIRMPGSQDEFRELADSFDDMLAQLEAHDAEQRRFVANASHELRTPLAVTRTMLDVARKDPDHDEDELLSRLESVNSRAIDLTQALLLMSRADRRAFTARQVDLSLAADEAVETMLPLAEKYGTSIDTSDEVALVAGSYSLLTQMITNLLHNAIVHNLPAGGQIWIRTQQTGDAAEVTVENTGERIDPTLVHTLTEPFQRGTERVRGDQSGAGLGLAIVKSIVGAHDGTLEIAARQAGGLRVTVTLPV